MSASTHPSSELPRIEEETVTNWRLIAAVGIGAVLFVLGTLATSVLLPHREETPVAPELAIRASVPPIDSPPRADSLVPHLSPIIDRAPVKKVSLPPAPANTIVKKESATTIAKILERAPVAVVPRRVAVVKESSAKPATVLPRGTDEASFEWRFKRRNLMTEEQLTAALWNVREIDLDAVAATSAKLLTKPPDKLTKVATALDILPKRADLSGLPMRQASACQLEAKTAQRIEGFSTVVRMIMLKLENEKADIGVQGIALHFQEMLKTPQIFQRRTDNDKTFSLAIVEPRDWLKREALPTLTQMFQGEEAGLRSLMVRLVSYIPDAAASAALARQAIFDVSADIREQAALSLLDRPKQEFRQVLLDGLRYPWPPVADHAAETLAALRDHEALPFLADLLDGRDPVAPHISEKTKKAVPELVRINHLRNCLLCHSPSFSRSDHLRALVPDRSKELPERQIFYCLIDGPIVRADITYLKQDFSVLHRVPHRGVWPAKQRFDYVIRMREATGAEATLQAASQKSAQQQAATYPQREAVLFALREISRKDAGTSSAAWRTLLAKGKEN